MAVLDFLRRRHVNALTAEKQTPNPTYFSLDKKGRRSAGSGGKSAEAAALALMAQAGAYIPFNRLYDLPLTLAITAISAVVRMYRIDYPPQVVFDESHFGNFAAKYINGTFFFDVHPPLAKLMIAGAGHLSGFDGVYDFETIGGPYEDKVPHVPMRLFCATFGLLTIPIAYLTIRAAGLSKLAGGMAAVFMCFENGFVANHRLILLDAPLLLFTALTALCWFNFQNQNQRPFRRWWWFWQLATGACLGAVASVKWVGLFTITTIGLNVISELWSMICDNRMAPLTFGKHFAARTVCLIVVPLSIYVACFWIHFKVLTLSGEGDYIMSAAFRYRLEGSILKSSYADVAYGSKINIRQNSGSGGYLHSHPLYYPTGSKQQQVTLYAHNDNHNDWIMIRSKITTEQEVDNGTEPLSWVKDGDIVKLMHSVTKAYLHGHKIQPPVTQSDYHFEVSAYNISNDSNNNWRVEILRGSENDPQSKGRIRSLRTMFRLIHVNMPCALYTRDKQLPAWGSKQQEVTCMRDAKKNQYSTFFVESSVDSRFNEKYPSVEYELPSFWQNFLALNTKMYTSNEALTVSHAYQSRPQDWLFLHRGINYWSKEKRHIYLLGNPIAFWASSIAACVFILFKGVMAFRKQRGWSSQNRSLISFYTRPTDFFTLAWLLHWLPFFTMRRQLFLHHYMPSLYFAILVAVVGFEYCTKSLSSPLRYSIAATITAAYLYVFWTFSPITYGLDWTQADCNSHRLRDSWDFNCPHFPKSLDEYKN